MLPGRFCQAFFGKPRLRHRVGSDGAEQMERQRWAPGAGEDHAPPPSAGAPASRWGGAHAPGRYGEAAAPIASVAGELSNYVSRLRQMAVSYRR